MNCKQRATLFGRGKEFKRIYLLKEQVLLSPILKNRFLSGLIKRKLNFSMDYRHLEKIRPRLHSLLAVKKVVHKLECTSRIYWQK